MSILTGIGVGVIAVAGTIAVVGTAAITLPIVAVVAGAALLTSAVLTGTGTIALNSYFDRPLTTNLSQNALIAAGTALIISAGALVVVVGCSTPVGMPFCAAAVPAIDAIEQVSLQVQYAYQVATGDPQAGETFIELQFEQNDGGAPGNTAFVELADLFATHGDEAVNLVNKYGDAAVDALQGEVVYFDNVAEFVSDLQDANPNFRIWYSEATGQVYVSNSTAQALSASQKLQSVNARGDDISSLISEIAEGSTHGSGNRVVLGAYDPNGGYIGDAIENGGIFFDTGDVVWDNLKNSGVDDLFLVNERFLINQLESKVDRIDFVGEDIWSVVNSQDPKVSNSFRAQEINWLLKNAGNYGYELQGSSWILSQP